MAIIKQESNASKTPVKREENRQSDNAQKFFLMQSQHQTLGQQITGGMKKSVKRQNFKQQPSFVDSSHPSSSFDSIAPGDLVVHT